MRRSEPRHVALLATSILLGYAYTAHADGVVRGVVRAVEQAAISTELTARITAIHAREGESFRKGDVIIEFDCRRQLATMAAAEAQQLEMQVTVDKLRLLQRAQSVGRSDLEISEARLAKAKAESDALRSQIDQCNVVAPFDGRVLDLQAQRHETVQPGKPFVSIVASGPLEIDLIVASDWVRWIHAGVTFAFLIEETQSTAAARVTRIGAAIDPISQTIKISAVIIDAGSDVLPGMSGTATFAQAAVVKP